MISRILFLPVFFIGGVIAGIAVEGYSMLHNEAVAAPVAVAAFVHP